MGAVSTKPSVWLRALAASSVILGLTIGVPWLLMVLVGNPYPANGIDWSGPVTDDTLLGLLAALAWVFWVLIVACLLVEAMAEIRTAAGRSGDWLTTIPGTSLASSSSRGC